MTGAPEAERPLSKVEVTGFEARHYDLLMNVLTLGTYPLFIRRVVRDLHIQPQDHILSSRRITSSFWVLVQDAMLVSWPVTSLHEDVSLGWI